MMTVQRRRWLAGALGIGLVALLLLLAAFDNLFVSEPRPLTTRTAVELYVPPPLPPPARQSESRSGGSTGTTVPMESRRIPATMDLMQLNVRLAAAETATLNLGGLGKGVGVGSGDGTGQGSGGGFSLATLSELDHLPTVVSAPLYPYPEEATARGINEFDLRFHILIDESGRVYPIGLIENPFPELNGELLEWASHVLFSPPTRLGIPVRAEYHWPVKMRLRP
jgi:hypothetical protein